MNLLELSVRLNVTRHNLKRNREAEAVEFAKLVQGEARSALGTYRYGWQPLQERTVETKKTGDSPLLETGRMGDTIEYTIKNTHNRTQVDVGSNDSVFEYQTVGTSRIPPRPVLEPATKAKEPEILDRFRKNVVDRSFR